MEKTKENAKEDRPGYRFKTFYFPMHLKKIWKEFNNICQERLPIGKIPNQKNRCKSIVIRRLIYKYVLENSSDPEVKRQIVQLIEEEKMKEANLLSKYLDKS